MIKTNVAVDSCTSHTLGGDEMNLGTRKVLAGSILLPPIVIE